MEEAIKKLEGLAYIHGVEAAINEITQEFYEELITHPTFGKLIDAARERALAKVDEE